MASHQQENRSIEQGAAEEHRCAACSKQSQQAEFEEHTSLGEDWWEAHPEFAEAPDFFLDEASERAVLSDSLYEDFAPAVPMSQEPEASQSLRPGEEAESEVTENNYSSGALPQETPEHSSSDLQPLRPGESAEP